MLQKRTALWHWCRFLCLLGVCVLLMGNATKPAFTQEPVPQPTPRAMQIVGGEEADPGEFPWQGWFTFRTVTGVYSCGATLIHPRWVLTAGHCAKNATITQVLLGAHTMSESGEAGRQELPVQKIYVHSSFNGWNNDNDIALLELASAAQETEQVRPIAIVNGTTDAPLYAPGKAATVTGWGALSEGGFAADTLQKVELPIVEHQTCAEAYSGGITENMLCAGYPEGGKDSCQGDSGGPLIVPDGIGGWKQAGIVSWGVGCARPEYYGVYTKVAQYAEWITLTTGGDVKSEPAPTPTPTLSLTPSATLTATHTGTATDSASGTETPTLVPTGATATISATTVPATLTPGATASATPTPSTPPTAPTATETSTPTVTPLPVGTIANGNFNAGPDGAWSETADSQQTPGTLIHSGESIPATDPVEGYAAWLGGQNGGQTTLMQRVTVPDAEPVALLFDYEIDSSDGCGGDIARVEMADPKDGANTVLAEYELCAATDTGGWQTALFDVSELAGQTRELRFSVETDGEAASHFFLDNVAFTSQLVDGLAPDPGDGSSLMTLSAQPGIYSIALDWEAPYLAQVAAYRVLRWNEQGAFVALGQVVETYFTDSHTPAAAPSGQGGQAEESCYSVEALDAEGTRLGESNRACAVGGQLALQIPDLVGRPQQSLAVPVSIQNAGSIRITATDLWLDFDPRVLSVRDIRTAPLSAGPLDWTYSETNVSESVQRLRINALLRDTAVAAGSFKNGEDPALHGSGTLFWLYFQIIGDAGMSSPLMLHPVDEAGAGSLLQVRDPSGETLDVPLVLQSGNAEIVDSSQTRATLGDVTGEGEIDQADTRAVLKFVTERTGLTVPQRRASDVTGDNKINAADAALLYAHSVSGEWTFAAPAEPTVETTVALTGVQQQPSGNIETTLHITNAHGIGGADLLLAYDPAVIDELSQVSMGSALRNGAVSWHSPERGFLRIALGSVEPIDGDASLLHLTWRLAEGAPAKQANFGLLDLHLSDVAGRDFVTGFANHTLLVQTSPVPLTSWTTIFLPAIMQQPDLR